MSFVQRDLTDDDRKWLEQFHISDPFSSYFSPDYGQFIVEDCEREAVLVCLGGQGYMKEKTKFYSEFPLVFYLIWNKYCLYIECHHEEYEMCETSEVYGIRYCIDFIRNVAKSHPERDIDTMKEAVKELLKEALTVYKQWYKYPYEKVEFIKMAEPICL